MSVMSDIIEMNRRLGQVRPAPKIFIGGIEDPNEKQQRVFLLHLNYAILGVFKSEEAAQAEADAFMVLHAGVWTKTSPQMLQWFNHGVGHVEIVGHDVQG